MIQFVTQEGGEQRKVSKGTVVKNLRVSVSESEVAQSCLTL